MKILHLFVLAIYIIGLIGMLRMHMDFAMYLMFAGMIIECVVHLVVPKKR
ncbi:hypothetical protein C5L31_000040 [Secundilactobacillus malefermentans]|uniref:Uncharacterized protein n=1 Tax=Secundilactobacillus malefermentans TaxID=176292 RepID=A0A4R5NII5_9LACO|nr:hypothetical protein [Secundilactobacillus malefermentans]TDG74393.1 hypothetical protein C5L31_000040 [Secundilactobacillus malefermentans]